MYKFLNNNISMPYFSVRSRVACTFLIFIMVLGLVSCSSRKESPGSISESDAARLIARISGGILAPEDSITVDFNREMVPPARIGTTADSPALTFSPAVSGKAVWAATDSLVFKPLHPLKLRSKYSGTVHLSSFSPKRKSAGTYDFKFAVAGRELDSLEGDFKPHLEPEQRKAVFFGKVSFTQKADPQTVSRGISLFHGSKKIKVKWQKNGSLKNYSFTSVPFNIPPKKDSFIMKVNGRTLELSGSLEKEFTLVPPGVFAVKEVVHLDQGNQPAVEIRFSEQVSTTQDIQGLISLETVSEENSLPLKTKIQKIGRSVFVSGDFSFGKSYRLRVSGIKSKWGVRLSADYKKVISFNDMKPKISFQSPGVFMTTASKQKIRFKTMNVSRVQLKVKKVFASNLGQFLQTENLRSLAGRNDGFNNFYVERVGIQKIKKTLEVGKIKNKWLIHEIDFQSLFPKDEKGIFLLELSFSRKDMLYAGLEKKRRYFYGRDYYSNPNSSGYLYRHGRVFKAVIQSNIGLSYKQGAGSHQVIALDLLKARPLGSVEIRLYSFQNQIIASAFTGSDGKAVFNDVSGKVFFVTGEKDGQRSVISTREMSWNYSTFATGGVSVSNSHLKSYVYTDRGVYRPGDNIHMLVIVRNAENSFPENHPIALTVFNPRNRPVYQMKSNRGTDGFYRFDIQTKTDDLTGTWKAKLTIGSQTVYRDLKVETVVPFRLKINFEELAERILPDMKFLDFVLQSEYLFGNPAAGLSAQVDGRIYQRKMSFPKMKHMVFSNESVTFKPLSGRMFSGKLDDRGKTRVNWKIPNLSAAPGALTFRINARVIEKGGRATRKDFSLKLDPFKYYVGIQKPQQKYGYGKVGSPINFRTVMTDSEGNTVSGRSIEYKIYRNSVYWWWEYDSRADFRARYKKDAQTRLIKKGRLVSGSVPGNIRFVPKESGEYFIEISDAMPGGHRSGFFFSSYYWGEAPSDSENAGVLTLKASKPVYQTGDIAEIHLKKPGKGILLVSVEKSSEILRFFSRVITGSDKKMVLRIPVTEDMLPNAYVTVSLVQPFLQTGNDRPVRMYGVLPLMVEKEGTRHKVLLKTASSLQSNKDFFIEVQTADRKPTQFTVAVVDEGLLGITDFKTPDAWSFFYAKESLGVKTFDLYSFVMGVERGDLFRLFSIGGEMAARSAYRKTQLEDGKKRRFTPVAMFMGPRKTNENGYAKVSFSMPNYIGAVRVMVVTATGERYGSAKKTLQVKTPLMILPTVPRLLGPGDSLTLPVTVFSMEKGQKKAKVWAEVKGPAQLSGPAEKSIKFDQPGEKEVNFSLKVLPAVGEVALTFHAQSKKTKTSSSSNVQVRASSPRIYSRKAVECNPGDTVALRIPSPGLPGTNRGLVRIAGMGMAQLGNRIEWLLNYPYGCVEQTVSAVFPQLFLKYFSYKSRDTEKAADRNINLAISKLKRFQLPSGGFSFWPGNSSVAPWGTSYAGHFLLEAKKLGYHVPREMFSQWKIFQKNRLMSAADNIHGRLYQIYGLTLAGDTPWGAMNLLRENSWKEMNNTEKWILGACYFIGGNREVAAEIRKDLGIRTSKYTHPGRSFGSWLRDKSMILLMAVSMEEWNTADKIYDRVVEEISSDSWFSTHSLGYALLGMGKYLAAYSVDPREKEPLLKGTVFLPSGKKINFEQQGGAFSLPLKEGFGKTVRVRLNKASTIKRGTFSVEWSGVPLLPDNRKVAKNLEMSVEWLNEQGERIDPGNVRQGDAFWGHIRIRSVLDSPGNVTNLALIQMVPSGWDIENLRIRNERIPVWAGKWKNGREKYLDIRDDRIMWFFDLPKNQSALDFIFKVTAVNPGSYVLPPTLAESMYTRKYIAREPGRQVKVSKR